MSVGIADITASIKQARKSKGLTQRELGKRVGLPQSHISKIEGGAVDLQLSSLVEIARALDLEVKLVPRKALPAIEGTVRAAVGTARASSTSRAIATIQKDLQLADQIKASYPELKEIDRFRSALKSIQTLQIDNQSLKSLHDALKPSKELAELFKEHKAAGDFAHRLKEQSKAVDFAKQLKGHTAAADFTRQIKEATDALQRWRKFQAHTLASDVPRQRPAYRLEDDE